MSVFDAVDIRHMAISSASSFDELMALVPPNYASAVRPLLQKVGDLAAQEVSMKATLAKWQDMWNAEPRQFPSDLPGKDRQPQLTKAFAESDEGRRLLKSMTDSYAKSRSEDFQKWIDTKTANLAMVSAQLKPAQMLKKALDVLGPRIKDVEESSRVSVFSDTPKSEYQDADGNVLPGFVIFDADVAMENGEIQLIGWRNSGAEHLVAKHLRQDYLAFALRLIQIIENKHSAEQYKARQKKDIQRAAEVEAADLMPGPSIQSMIDRAVNARLGKGKTVSRTPLINLLDTYEPFTPTERETLGIGRSTQASKFHRGGPRSDRSQRGASEAGPSSTFQAAHFFRLLTEEDEAGRQRRQEGQGPSRSRSGVLQTRDHQAVEETHGGRQGFRTPSQVGESPCREGQAVSVSTYSTWTLQARAFYAGEVVPPPSNFRYDVSSSYPDWLLTIPLPSAAHYVLLNTPVNILQMYQYKSHIHCSPGVNIPKEIEYQLSVGMRYMFYSPQDKSLILKAYEDFERRLLWRLYFAFKGIEDDNDYDPDFEPIGKKVSTKKPKLPMYIFNGFAKGRMMIHKSVSAIPSEPAPRTEIKALQPSRAEIKQFLLENKYVVTGTDKNLGIAVSERDWIISKSQDLLNDTNNYREIPYRDLKLIMPRGDGRWKHGPRLDVETILNYQNEQTLVLSDMSFMVDIFRTQVPAYLRSSCTPFKVLFNSSLPDRNDVDALQYTEPHKIPAFYGIPKIHKEPVKMRPIIPCHSAVQNTAAKLCSKILKPIVQSAPTIIHGTKDLAIKLSKTKIDTRRKYFIVTGDVVAYYPNIPIEVCLERVEELFKEYYFADSQPDYVFAPMTLREFHFSQLFVEALRLGNTNLITQFQKKYYLQIRGLAMGVASSPDLANLYGYYYERKCRFQQDDRIAIYGRYIDDCFAIVYAKSADEALNILNLLVIESCVIEWNVSESHSPFLDMMLYKDENNNLQYRPYRKARNHQERVPWISHHPFDVKRGTFLGEMSRLATISSTFSNYRDALQSLSELYIVRGYPSEFIYKWLKENISKRWENRLSDTQRDRDVEGVLVLKSEFNTVWNYFNAKELGETIFNYWREWLKRAEREEFDDEYPRERMVDFEGFLYNPDTGMTTSFLSKFADGSRLHLPDVTKTNLLNRRLITSRKRTQNLFDLTSIWKRIVLQHIEVETVDDIETVVAGNKDPAGRIDEDGVVRWNQPTGELEQNAPLEALYYGNLNPYR